MTGFQRITLVAVAAGLVAAVSTGCGGDDSTATAPISAAEVTTTHFESPTITPPSGTDTSKPGMPATVPNPSTTQPKDFPGASSTPPKKPDAPKAPVSAKQQRYLDALKRQHVVILGDTDNTIAFTMAQFVCDQRGKGGDPTSMKAFVVAAVGPGEKTVESANIKADKVIRAANEYYC
ncbi:MAG: DUF732 domain-containing protein [Gordonia sp. (in: high G+C Gram-positive bacteria)]|uniref:DUF732 domain-containing protein n=1 Tax=Gordonia sp. (in: high G+C Gram-positive bacteria) TaxID=84139 RepID=UPI0039E37E92